MTAPPIRLPARLDTLGALRLPAMIGDDAAALDASAVEEIGFAALQWLACRLRDRAVAIGDPSAAFTERARDAGLATALLGEPAAPGATETRVIVRLADAALHFGREPLEALARLRAAGATIAARPRSRDCAAPDEIGVDIVVGLAPGMGEEAVTEALAAFEDAYALAPDEPPAPTQSAPAPAPAPAPSPGPSPAATVGIVVAQDKLARVTTLADELAAAQATLAHALGPARVQVTSELGEVDRLWRILQSAIADIGAAPIADLLGLPRGGWAWQGAGLEIERAVIDRIAAPLLATLAGARCGGTVSAAPDGSFALLSLAPAPAADATLAGAIAAVGGRIEGGDGTALAVRLPRSLSLIDALVVDVGAGCYALPVTHMIEALRPTRDALDGIGPGRALLRFGEGYVPIVAVGAAFDVAGWEADPQRAVLVVVEAARGRIALLVDAIVDQQQVTVKPIEGGIGRPRGTLGAAIVRGNRVALVIDVDGLGG